MEEKVIEELEDVQKKIDQLFQISKLILYSNLFLAFLLIILMFVVYYANLMW